MREEGIGSTAVVTIVIVVVAAVAGGYYALKSGIIGEKMYDELKSGENLINENVVALSLNPGEIKKHIENIQNFRSHYNDNIEKIRSSVLAQIKEKVQESGFEESYTISGSYFKVLFSFEWENELNEGKAPAVMIDKFQKKGIQLAENAFLTRGENDWFIGSQESGRVFRLHKKNNNIDVRNLRRMTISVTSTLDKFSTVEGADKIYEAMIGQIKRSWENMGYDPEEKAKGSLQGENYELGEETFVRYYENFMYGKPLFGITFRERNVFAGINVFGDIPNLSEKSLALIKILENRSEKA